jgi:hypothetical protein
MKLNELCAEPIVNTPDAFANEWKQEAAMWRQVIKSAGVQGN